MTDPVSIELDRRRIVQWKWRSAFAVAVLIHVAVAVAVILAPESSGRPITLPTVKVRVAALPPSVAVAPARRAPSRPPAARAVEPEPAKSEPVTPKPAAKKPRAEKPAPRASAPAPPSRERDSSVPPLATDESTVAGSAESDPGIPAAGLRSAGGALALGGGAVEGETAFPYAYYLNRVLGLIESNWYRPPAPPGALSRIRCRIDRNGRLLEAGIESSSAVPAFDRAALRAVYASVPFPPLPQGYRGSTLTLHLEFGQ